MTIQAHDTAASSTRRGFTSHAGRSPMADPEETDLERRVLAHERILQALIAHMAESEPKFFERLTAVFSDPLRAGRREHDYTDTDAYADRFIRKIRPVVALPEDRGAARGHEGSHSSDLDRTDGAAIEQRMADPTLLQLAYRAGIWEVTKDGAFYGHYYSQQPAFDAVEAAAQGIVASGGCVDILLRDERTRGLVAGQSGPSGIAAVNDVEVRSTEAAARSAILPR